MAGGAARCGGAPGAEGGEPGGRELALPRSRHAGTQSPIQQRCRACACAPQIRAHHSQQEYWIVVRYYWPRLFVTALAWSCSNFAVRVEGCALLLALQAALPAGNAWTHVWTVFCLQFYGHKLSQSDFVKVIVGPNASNFEKVLITLLNSAVSLAGCAPPPAPRPEASALQHARMCCCEASGCRSILAMLAHHPAPLLPPRPAADYAAAALIDRRWYGRVRMQAAGFFMLFLLFLLCGALYSDLQTHTGAFQVGWPRGSRGCPPLLSGLKPNAPLAPVHLGKARQRQRARSRG